MSANRNPKAGYYNPPPEIWGNPRLAPLYAGTSSAASPRHSGGTIACFVPVPSLFSPCYELTLGQKKSHGIEALNVRVEQVGGISPVFFPDSRDFEQKFFPV